MDLAGKPVVQHVIERAQMVCNSAGVLVATSIDSSDDPLASFCKQIGVPYFRGNLTDVSDRFAELNKMHSLSSFVRISGDSPLIDPSLIEWAISAFNAGKVDLVSNIVQRTFPKGQSVEVIRSKTFLESVGSFFDDFDKEHVTPYFYRNSDLFDIKSLTATYPRSDVQLSIDTKEDFDLIEAICVHKGMASLSTRLKQTLEVYDKLIVS